MLAVLFNKTTNHEHEREHDKHARAHTDSWQRGRPALLFDEVTGAPTHLYNGAIDQNKSVPWYAMVQKIRMKKRVGAHNPIPLSQKRTAF